MPFLDSTDWEILDILSDNSRSTLKEISDEVGLSPPSVRERIDKLESSGVIEKYTIEIDESTFQTQHKAILTIKTKPEDVSKVFHDIKDAENTGDVYLTMNSEVIAIATIPEQGLSQWLQENTDTSKIIDYEVRYIETYSNETSIPTSDVSLKCSECGNRVTEQGRRKKLDSEIYYFCCVSCEENFVEKYKDLKTNQ